MSVMRPEVVISRPCVRRMPGGRVAVSCRVETGMKGLPENLFFSVDEVFADFLVDERADAFLVGLIPLIMQAGGRVRCEAPVSKRLLHNLRYRLSNIMREFKEVRWGALEVEAPADDTCFSGGHVGTGCSCGVDSSATVAVYTGETVPRDMRVDTLAFFNVGSHGDFRHYTEVERARCEELYRARRARAQAFADTAGLPLFTVESNIYEFGAGLLHVAVDSFRNAAAVLALGKYFSTYHCASSVKATEFEFTLHNIASCDCYLLEALSTESTRLLSALSAYDRYERGKLLADYGPARKFLDVCSARVGNCTDCPKCLRTMFQFEMDGILDRFSEVFDVDWFRAHPRRVLRRLMDDDRHHAEFLTQMRAMRRTAWRLPYSYFTYRFWFAVGSFLEGCADLRRRLKRKMSA